MTKTTFELAPISPKIHTIPTRGLRARGFTSISPERWIVSSIKTRASDPTDNAGTSKGMGQLGLVSFSAQP
ncbi:hypothetical protein TNCV_785301 [Trichonephila clavipes]|nr:hypothetical protein TNCV_785301 [Trichonephila clavipes]